MKPGDLIQSISPHASIALLLCVLPNGRGEYMWLDNKEIAAGPLKLFVLISE